MKLLVGLVIALTPVLADAKTFNDGKGGTWDCKTDATVTINGNAGTYTLKGACKVITVNGNENKLTIEKVGALTINGNKSTADAGSVDTTLSVAGNDNTVTYKAGEPTTSAPGSRNTISGPPKKTK